MIGNVSSVQEVPSWRWDKKKFYSQDRREENKTVSKWGGFIDGIDCFDAPFFNISRREAEFMDPQQRLMLELAWACFEDAGYAPSSFQGSRTGVYIGVFNFDYKELVEKSAASIEGHMSTGLYNALIPNRISYFFNLSGPSIPVDTACSSSLVALHDAAQALRCGECETALVGGVNLLCTPTHFISFSKTGMLSRDGVCRTFDYTANGYVRGEGAALVLLKPLDRAIRDDDCIWGVIRGTAVNHGGKVDTLTTPNDVRAGRGHCRGLGPDRNFTSRDRLYRSPRDRYRKGRPHRDQRLEAGFFSSLALRHGIEVPAHSCGLGSVKTSIGHLEAAAGMAGLIKTLLCMRYGTLPALVHFTKLNTRIDFAGTPFYVVDRQQAWPRRADDAGRMLPRRAGVSSFGFGGVNAHVVIEEYVAPEPVGAAVKGPALVVLSAKTEERLREQVADLLAALPAFEESDLVGIAYTLQVGRDAMEERLAVAVTTLVELGEKLAAFVAGGEGITGLYRGQVKRNKEALSVFAADEDMAQTLDSWVAKGKYGKLLDLWVKGLAVQWEGLYGAVKPRRVGLPTYPFARERYWVPQGVRPGTRTSVVSAEVLHPGWRDEALFAVEREEGESGSVDLCSEDGEVRLRLSGLAPDGAEGSALAAVEDSTPAEIPKRSRHCCSRKFGRQRRLRVLRPARVSSCALRRGRRRKQHCRPPLVSGVWCS